MIYEKDNSCIHRDAYGIQSYDTYGTGKNQTDRRAHRARRFRSEIAGRTVLGDFAPKFAELNDDVLFGEAVWNDSTL